MTAPAFDARIVLVHVPRTAGTTLALIMRHHYRGGAFRGGGNVFARPDEIESRLAQIAATERIRAVGGHLTFGLVERYLPGARCVAVLREPVDRTLSHLQKLAGAKEPAPGRRQRGLVPPGLPVPPPDLPVEEALARGYVPDNLQVRMTCGVLSPFDELPAGSLELAKKHLRDRFEVVGTTERFDEALALLNVRLGWPTVAYRRSRARRARLTRDDLTPPALAAIEERNLLDRELYGYVEGLLSEAVEGGGDVLQEELAVLRDATRRWNDGDVLSANARVALALEEAELAQSELRARRLT